MNLRIGMLGCGLIGRKRVNNLPPKSVVYACDLDFMRAQELAALTPGCRATTSTVEVMESSDVDAVMISTLNSSLAPLALEAVKNGKHVLVEKPAAISLKELEELEAAATQNNVLVRVGYNHRYHPACLKAVELFQSGVLGPLMFLRGRYGHGGRVGYEKEWRADPNLSGGGELIDQGVHLVDLAGIFLGEFTSVEGHVATYFWDMPVDDNAFLNLRNAEGRLSLCISKV